jgi:pimeloyl-ACP methyl ester carboxylesterase
MGAGRLEVRSADGTPLAVWVEGQGPPLVLVHGSMCDHTASDPLVAELRATMTTFAVDRRGFGASGDAAGYALEREFEDAAAVVETVAARPGALDGITAPTLLLAGAESHPVLRQATDRARAAIPGARVRVLDGTPTSPTATTRPWSPR